MKELKFSFEYFCYPFWSKNIDVKDSIFENILIDKVSLLSKELKQEIKLMDSIYQGTYNDDYPPDLKWDNQDQEIRFCERLLELSVPLFDELSQFYTIVFDKERWENRLK